MRRLFLVIISCLLFSCQSRFRGVYYTPSIVDSNVVMIEFLKNKRFKYEIKGHLGTSTYGVGTYKTDNDSLKLIFDDTTDAVKSSYSILEREKNVLEDSIQLNFEVKVKFNDNLVNIYGAFIKRKSDPKDYRKFATDKEGFLTLTVKKIDTVQDFEVLYLGYENLNIPVTTSSSKKITIELDIPGPEIISDTTIVIDINRFKENFKKVKKK